MADPLQILLLTFIGVFLLWFGYTLFFRLGTGQNEQYAYDKKKSKKYSKIPDGIPGAPRTCPVCSAQLLHGERVHSSAFPSMGGSDRLMHVDGCPYCLDAVEGRDRICPVCGIKLHSDEHLIARLFDKPGRSHVHVLGCSRCRGPRSGR